MTLTITNHTNAFTNQIIEENAVHQTFKNIYERDLKDQYTNANACFDELLFFTTVIFKEALISIVPTSAKAHPINEYKKLTYFVNRSIFGKRLGRKRTLQPKGFAWVDFEGSRAGHGSTGLINPHIHSLMIVRPEFRSQFQKLMQNALLQFQGTVIDDIRIEQFNSQKGTVSDLAGYCMKGLRGIPNDRRQWLETTLPA